MSSASTTALLKTGFNEYVKQHIEYDIGGRMIAVYEARSNASDGEVALLTSYSYDGTSNRVVFMKEEPSLWQGIWG